MIRRDDHILPGSTTPSARILCQRKDGIGCRLLTLLWTMRLARTADAGVLMFWPDMDPSYGPGVAGDLFDQFRLASPPFQNRLRIVDGDCRHYFRPSPIVLSRKERYEPGDLIVPVGADPLRQRLPVIVGHWEGPFLAPGESRQAALAEMPPLFSELPFRNDLMREVERIAGASRLADTVAVHVRRGDIVQNLRAAVSEFRLGDSGSKDLLDERVGTFLRRCVSVETLAKALREFVDQGRQILVFSDEPTIHKDLSDALGASAILPAASLIETEFTPMQQAFVEAVLMSRCRCILGARSAYSAFANIIGGANQVVLRWERRPAEDSAAFVLATISDQLGSHPEKTHIERRLHEEVVRLQG